MEETSSFRFDDARHVYYLGEKRLYGVTSVLGVIAKPALVQWSADMTAGHLGWLNPKKESMEACLEAASAALETFKNHTAEAWHQMLCEARVAHNKKKDDAATKGTDVHAEVEQYVKACMYANNGHPLTVEESNSYSDQANKFIAWAIENNVLFLESEKQIYSEKLWVAGTVDLLFEKDGKRYVGDIKTTSGIFDRTPFFQTAAYQLMLEGMGEPSFDGRCIIRLGKDNSFEVVYSYAPVDKEGFLAALALFKALEVPVTEKQKAIKKAITKKAHSAPIKI